MIKNNNEDKVEKNYKMRIAGSIWVIPKVVLSKSFFSKNHYNLKHGEFEKIKWYVANKIVKSNVPLKIEELEFLRQSFKLSKKRLMESLGQSEILLDPENKLLQKKQSDIFKKEFSLLLERRK